eukprot:6178652-Pleurochrysis_carterae.AAC.3
MGVKEENKQHQQGFKTSACQIHSLYSGKTTSNLQPKLPRMHQQSASPPPGRSIVSRFQRTLEAY